MPTIPITLVGQLGNDPDSKVLPTGRPRANFRMAVNRATLDRSTGEYTEHEPSWFQVECYGALAGNVTLSLAKGTSVIVQGHLTIEEWVSDGRTGRSAKVIAQHVGPNLKYGTSAYSKVGGRQQTNGSGVDGAPDGWGSAGIPDPAPSQAFVSDIESLEPESDIDEPELVDEVARATAEVTAPF